MRSLLITLLFFSIPVIAETNNLDKTFLEITLNSRTFRIFDSPNKSQEVEKNCIRNKLKENNLSKAKYNKWSYEHLQNKKKLGISF